MAAAPLGNEHEDTICVQGGYQPGNGESRTPPIIQATTFKYTSSEQMSRLFDLSESGYFYTRLQNPTNDTANTRTQSAYRAATSPATANRAHRRSSRRRRSNTRRANR